MRKTLEDIRKGLNRESLANFPNQVENEKQERPKEKASQDVDTSRTASLIKISSRD